MGQARQLRRMMQEDHESTWQNRPDIREPESTAPPSAPPGRNNNTAWFLGGAAAAIVIVVIASWLKSDIPWDGHSMNNPAMVTADQISRVPGLQANSQRVDELSVDLEFLNQRVRQLTESFTYLEVKLIRIEVLADSITELENKLVSTVSQQPVVAASSKSAADPIESPASGATDDRAADNSGTYQAYDVAMSQPLTRENKDTALDEQDPAESGHKGPWFINLASLPSKADADRFTARARSRDIDAEYRSATVNGKQVWRVQITGFPTAYDAKSHANPVREKLGLEEVWISKN